MVVKKKIYEALVYVEDKLPAKPRRNIVGGSANPYADNLTSYLFLRKEGASKDRHPLTPIDQLSLPQHPSGMQLSHRLHHAMQKHDMVL